MTYRPINTGDRTAFQANPGAAPQLEWIDVADLYLDDTYQRPLLEKNWKHIIGISAQFQWSRFSALTVSRGVGGKYAIIDGQHRAHAAVLCGIRQVPCLVHRLSVAEQAASFSTINGNVQAMTIFHIYRAALAAREKWAVDAEAVVRAAGCKLMTANKSAQQKKPGEVFCVGLVRGMVLAGEGEVVRKGLSAIRGSSGGSEPEFYAARILKPFFSALASNVQFLKLDLAGFLDAFSLEDAIYNASQLARNDRSLSTTPEAQRLIREALQAWRVQQQVAAQ